jgi:hypothetical protein
MQNLTSSQREPRMRASTAYRVVAHNYAFDSDNRIHSDDIAAQYGFKGGLVPGVADIAYLARAVHDHWGDAWLNSGTIEAKLIKPIYHGEVAEAHVTSESGSPEQVTLALNNPEGLVCAAGRAGLGDASAPPDVNDYPRLECVPLDDRPDPEIETFPSGLALSAYEYTYHAAEAEADAGEKFVDPWPGSNPWHPASCLNDANRLLRANVKLGPWIHTASNLSLHGAPADGETISLRGRVLDTFEKRGHVMTQADIGVFADERPIAHVVHTAIIRLAPAE